MHKGIKFECEYCDYAAATSTVLNIHVGSRHLGIKYQCEDCDYKAGTKSNLKVHRLGKHTDTKFSCPFCDFNTVFKANLKNHIKNKHTNSADKKEKTILVCDQCDFMAGCRYALTIHINTVLWLWKFTHMLHQEAKHFPSNLFIYSDMKFKREKK